MQFCQRNNNPTSPLTDEIPKRIRIFCIIQLCIAFSVLLWILCSPFTESLYESKKTLSTIRWLVDDQSEYFDQTAPEVKNQIFKLEAAASRSMQESFLNKSKQSIENLFLGIPISKLLWLLLALLLPILVLKQVDGARELFWLFPVLAVFYALQNFPATAPEPIYPSESYLENRYLESPITGSIEQQKNLLEQAWKKFIVTEWSKESVSASDEEKFVNGLYHFILNKTLQESSGPSKPGPWTLACYFIWNLTAALVVGVLRKDACHLDKLPEIHSCTR